MTASPPDLKIQGVVSEDVIPLSGSRSEALREARKALEVAGYKNPQITGAGTQVTGRKTVHSRASDALTVAVVPKLFRGLATHPIHLTPGRPIHATVSLERTGNGHLATVTVDDGRSEARNPSDAGVGVLEIVAALKEAEAARGAGESAPGCSRTVTPHAS